MRTPDHRFIAGKFAIECNPRSSEPDERMEPQDAQRNFVEQTEQIVTPSCMGQFVDQYSVEFTLIEQPINAGGKQDTRVKNSVNRGAGMAFAEAHRNSICYEIRGHTKIIQTGRHLNLATLSTYTRDQSHEHHECASCPYHRKHNGRTAFCHIPYRAAESAKRCGPGQMRRPELIDYCAGWHDEIERGQNPNPIFRGGACAPD